jgi:hypothetical protein
MSRKDATGTYQIEFADINTLKKNPKNPRVIKDAKFAKLVQSLKDFPQMLRIRPIVVNAKGVIIGGNQRYEAAKAAGMTSVPIIRATNLTKKQEQEFAVKDNVSAGDWDLSSLAEQFEIDDLVSWGVDIQGFDPNFNADEFFEREVSFTVKGGAITFKFANKETYEAVVKKIAAFKKPKEQVLLELLGL